MKYGNSLPEDRTNAHLSPWLGNRLSKELNSKNAEPGGSLSRSGTLGEHARGQRLAVSWRDLAENQELCLSLEGSGIRILLTGYKARNAFINAKLQLDV
jgi:hypothetical protein